MNLSVPEGADIDFLYKLFVKHKNITVNNVDANNFFEYCQAKDKWMKLKIEVNFEKDKTKFSIL